MIIEEHFPNKQIVSTAPGNTNWTAITLPLPQKGVPGARCIVTTMTAAGAAGSDFLIAADLAAIPTTVAQGYPIFSGGYFSTTIYKTLYVKLSAGTDLVQTMFLW